MIPYQELVSALERWRIRKGLPVGGGGAVAAAPAPAPAAPRPTAPPTAPPRSTAGFAAVAPAPMSSPPSAPPVSARPPLRAPTEESLDLAEGDVLEEDHYDSEGQDFAMSFGGSAAAPAPAPAAYAHDEAAYGHAAAPGHGVDDDDLPDEKTAIGLPQADTGTSPFATHPGTDTLDAEGEVIDEHLDGDDPHHP